MEDLKTSEAPLCEGWVECELGEICEITMGQSPPSSSYNPDGLGLPFFQGKAEFTDLHPVVKKWCLYPKKEADKDDLLLSVRAPVGSVNIADQKCAIGRGLAAIRYNYCNKFIFYLLRNIEHDLDKKGTGTTFKAISGSVIKSQIIFFPPLPEQRAIVSNIEQLFSELDNGISNLKAARGKLEVYRQAVLKKAFDGELTSTILSETILGDVVEKPKYGTSKKCSYDLDGVPVVRIPNIIKGKVSHDDLKFGIFDKTESNQYSLQTGDLLTIRSNGSVDIVGRCAIVTKNDINCLFAGYLIRLRPQKDMIDSKYLYYCLESHELRVQIEKRAKSTSGVNNINSEELSNLKIPICSLEEQKQIVTEIESRLSVCDNIKETIDESLKQAEALRQSILKKAFEGRLLSADELEACRNDPDWEPAEKLLERIKTEHKAGSRK